VLVAPYLSYMRQDTAFRPGEAVSQRLVGRLVAETFDGVVSVDPHLHRTKSLGDVFPATAALAVSAAPALASLLQGEPVPRDTLLIGPDEESGSLVAAMASALGLEGATGEKTRRGDRTVSIRLPERPILSGRPVILVDDVISTGTTLVECARIASKAGASRIEALAVHALFAPEREAEFRAAGIARVRCTDSMPHPCGTAPLAPVLAAALRSFVGGAGRQ
jgi:ribose-phosphate pyrophosphokinase